MYSVALATVCRYRRPMHTNGDGFLALILVLAVALAYFLPSVVAWQRRHHQRGAIFVLNLLLGWTALGWIVALVWSFTAVR